MLCKDVQQMSLVCHRSKQNHRDGVTVNSGHTVTDTTAIGYDDEHTEWIPKCCRLEGSDQNKLNLLWGGAIRGS